MPYGQDAAGAAGMPVLYYRADPNGAANDPNYPDNPASIYNYRDNQAILELGVPGRPDLRHPMVDPKLFYQMIAEYQSPTKPYRSDSYVLLSAGFDGLYGTADDVLHSGRPSKPRREPEN